MSAACKAIASQLERIIQLGMNKARAAGAESTMFTSRWLKCFLMDDLGLTAGFEPRGIEFNSRIQGACKTIYVNVGQLDLAVCCNWDNNPDGINSVMFVVPLYLEDQRKVYLIGIESPKREVYAPSLERWNEVLTQYTTGLDPKENEDV